MEVRGAYYPLTWGPNTTPSCDSWTTSLLFHDECVACNPLLIFGVVVAHFRVGLGFLSSVSGVICPQKPQKPNAWVATLVTTVVSALCNSTEQRRESHPTNYATPMLRGILISRCFRSRQHSSFGSGCGTRWNKTLPRPVAPGCTSVFPAQDPKPRPFHPRAPRRNLAEARS